MQLKFRTRWRESLIVAVVFLLKEKDFLVAIDLYAPPPQKKKNDSVSEYIVTKKSNLLKVFSFFTYFYEVEQELLMLP